MQKNNLRTVVNTKIYNNFRKTVFSKYGKTKGSIRQGTEQAMLDWIKNGSVEKYIQF